MCADREVGGFTMIGICYLICFTSHVVAGAELE